MQKSYVYADMPLFRNYTDGSPIQVRNAIDAKPLEVKVVLEISKQKRTVVDPINAGTLLGHQVVKRTREHKRPDRRLLQVEELSAPALGCYPKMSSFRDEPIAGTNETTVTTVKVGAIDKAQLDIPSGYIERSPSEVLTMIAAKQGRKCTTYETNGFPLLDGAYRLRGVNTPFASGVSLVGCSRAKQRPKREECRTAKRPLTRAA